MGESDFSLQPGHIERERAEAIARYPQLWARMMTEWHQPSAQDCAWLLYAANYLLRTDGVRWAIDPLRLKQRLPQAPDVDVVRDLGQLAFVLLTHRHADHLDLDLLRSLRTFPIRWVVPEAILPLVLAEAGLDAAQVIIPRALEPLGIEGITITPFDGLHWEKQPDEGELPLRGVPATGYLVEFNGKRWLFPGDTRTYQSTGLPAWGAVDGLFAHLWLGRGCALLDEPPLLEAFCRFYSDLNPRRVVITHLHEFGRDAPEYWADRHVQQVCRSWQKIAPDLPVAPAYMGERVYL